MTPTLSQGQAEPTDAERQAFEAAYRSLYPLTCEHTPGKFDHTFGSYHDVTVLVAWALWRTRAALAASSAAPTADLRAAIEMPEPEAYKGVDCVDVGVGVTRDVVLRWEKLDVDDEPLFAADAIRHAAAQLAAVAAPEARMLTPAERFDIGNVGPMRIADIEAVQRKFCEVNGIALVHPAASGSSMPSAAPLSEPCALDQGARPVRLLTDEEVVSSFSPHWHLAKIEAAPYIQRKFCEVNGIAPPVDQQEGSTQ